MILSLDERRECIKISQLKVIDCESWIERPRFSPKIIYLEHHCDIITSQLRYQFSYQLSIVLLFHAVVQLIVAILFLNIC